MGGNGSVDAGVGWAVGVRVAKLGGEGVAVGAGDGGGCAAVGEMAADSGKGWVGVGSVGWDGKGAGEGVVSRGAGEGVAGKGAGSGWTQAARARQIAAHRAAVLGEHSFAPPPEQIYARREIMVVKLSNVGGAPLNCVGAIVSDWLGAFNNCGLDFAGRERGRRYLL